MPVLIYSGGCETASIYPGVAKFGIALEWGSRGLEFESRHSDQEIRGILWVLRIFSNFSTLNFTTLPLASTIYLPPYAPNFSAKELAILFFRATSRWE